LKGFLLGNLALRIEESVALDAVAGIDGHNKVPLLYLPV
jgi:hypothetical protein